MQTVTLQDTVQSIIPLHIGDSVSNATAQKLKEAGFPQPERTLLGQTWYTECGHIIAAIARNDYSGELWWRKFDAKEANYAIVNGDETKQKLWQPLNESIEEVEVWNYHDPLSVFMPGYFDIIKEMDGWKFESDSNVGLHTCYLETSLEIKCQGTNELEVWAMAWLLQKQKQSNLKEGAKG
jgi:hypothetical protein